MAKGRKLIIAALVALSACQGQPPAVVQEDHLVVEAWICSGQPPMVQLTSSIQPREQNQDLDALDEHVIRRAKVSISDGENEVTLTGMPWKGCLPPYVYTTSRMIGEEGKTYTLTVETSTHKARAVTSPPPFLLRPWLRKDSVSARGRGSSGPILQTDQASTIITNFSAACTAWTALSIPPGSTLLTTSSFPTVPMRVPLSFEAPESFPKLKCTAFFLPAQPFTCDSAP